MELIKIHEVLNNVYSKADIMYKDIAGKHKCSLNSYNKHYILLDGKYELQKYFMPVVSIEDKGDICFNLDGVSFEFYLTKDELGKIKIDDLIKKFPIEIYEKENCLKELFKPGDRLTDYLEKLNNTNALEFGISIDCEKEKTDEIVSYFFEIYSYFNK